MSKGWIKYLVTISIGALATLIIIAAKNIFTAEDTKTVFHILTDAFFAPGVTISGGVTIDDCTHIGTGATVIQGVHIGSHVLIGAGAVVVKDIPDNCIVAGNPAKILKYFI